MDKLNKHIRPDIHSMPIPDDNVAARKIGDELLLVPIHRTAKDVDSIYTLNETAAFVWECLDGKTSISDIIEKVTNTFDAHHDDVTDDVIAVLENLKELNAISF